MAKAAFVWFSGFGGTSFQNQIFCRLKEHVGCVSQAKVTPKLTPKQFGILYVGITSVRKQISLMALLQDRIGIYKTLKFNSKYSSLNPLSPLATSLGMIWMQPLGHSGSHNRAIHPLLRSLHNHQPNCPLFISSVRSSSGYHGLIEIRSRPLFQIFQILQILK